MRKLVPDATPFEQGVRSLAACYPAPNPFGKQTVQYRNFELGRQHALKYRIGGATARLNDGYSSPRS